MALSKFLKGSPMLSGDNTIPGIKLPEELELLLPGIITACHNYGLDFYPIIVQMLDYSEISEVAAYGGFPVRYPHWQWGMEYNELQQGYMHGMHKIYEMVVNTNPVYIYCLDSNTLVDNVTVVAHAIGHSDFFKNNVYFSPTSQNMMNELANHGTRIRKYMQRWGKEKVVEFIDYVLRIETLIDPTKAFDKKVYKDPVIKDSRTYRHPIHFDVAEGHDYMDEYVNPKEWLEDQHRKILEKEAADFLEIFKSPTKDIMGFIRDYAPLKPWQADIIAMLYEEMVYFSPQRPTKTSNEGWACLKMGSLVNTDKGFIAIDDIVDNKLHVYVNGNKVSNWFVFKNRKTVDIVTNRGYNLGGASNHRIFNYGKWIELSKLSVGEKVEINSSDYWPKLKTTIDYEISVRDGVHDICKKWGVSTYAFHKVFSGGVVKKQKIVENCILDYKKQLFLNSGIKTQNIRRKVIKIPQIVTEDLASFLGYMIGDGHISVKKRSLGLTTGDLKQAENYMSLTKSLFGLVCKNKWDDSSKNGRWRVSVTSANLKDFLVSLGMKTGICARKKVVPECILQSPKSVVSAFIRAYFDCDGYAGTAGVILSTSSEQLGKQIQIILLNYGILSTRKKNKDETWHVIITSSQAIKYRDEIGFGLNRKQTKLNEYIASHQWFKKEDWTDEIISIENGKGDVYDISVDDTHRYTAQGFINHNSFCDFKMMAEQGFVCMGQDSHDMGIIEYAKHKMGVLGGKYSMNPYKLGFCLFKDIEERWDKGMFGTEWDECQNIQMKEEWDKKLGLGHEKVLEVRKYCNDFTLLAQYFTPEFCNKYEFFEWKRYPNGEYVIEDRDPKRIRKKLMTKHLNGGLPDIRLVDPNHLGKRIMFLEHQWDNRMLYAPYVKATLEALKYLWGNDVYLSTRNNDDKEMVYITIGHEVMLVSREDYEKSYLK